MRLPCLYSPFFFNRLYQGLFGAVADNQAHSRQSRDRLGASFRVTAGHHQQRTRMASACLGDHAARTAIAQVGNGAGIHNIDVGEIIKVALRKACRAHLLANSFAVSLVHLAAKRGNCEGSCCC